MLKKISIFFFLFIAWLPVCQADLASDTVYLTWQRSPESTMTIQWLTNDDQAKNTVFYKLSHQNEWQKADGYHFALSKKPAYYLHRVELTHLQPGKAYQFKINDKPQIYSFRTMPNELSHPIRFLVGGDMYHNDPNEKATMERTCIQAAKCDPDFIVLGGDIAYAVKNMYSSETIERWVEWLHIWSHCMVSDEGFLIPVVAAIGNHDLLGHFGQTPAQARIFLSLFPRQSNSIYSVLDFGNYLSLFLLDSGHANPIKGAQTAWLKSALQARRHIPYRYPIYHVPAYPSVRSFNNKHSSSIRRWWVPVFEKEGVQMTFEHHDHAYKRTYPLLNGRVHDDGIIYMGDGAWSVDEPRTPRGLFSKRFYIAKFVSIRHFILVTMDHDKQRIMSISDHGDKIDDYTIPLQYKERTPVDKFEKFKSWVLQKMK